MEDNITFIMRREWLDNIADLPIEQQDKIIADIIRYGSEIPLAHEEDRDVKSYVNFVKKSIDDSKNKFKQKQENGKTNGRKKTVDSKAVWRLAQQGLTAEKIGDELGISKDSVYHDEGWKHRKESSWGIL